MIKGRTDVAKNKRKSRDAEKRNARRKAIAREKNIMDGRH